MRVTHQRRAGMAVAAVLLVAGGCWPFQRQEAQSEAIPLVVRNHGYFDVTVSVVPSSGAQGRRLTTVTGNSGATVTLRRGDVQPSGMLVVRLHAIGTRYSWVSPGVQVDPGTRAYLEIYTNSDGALGRSTLWASPADAPARAPDSAAVR
jgi:hypothetical protein